MKILLKSATALSLILAATSFAAAKDKKFDQDHRNKAANQSVIIQDGSYNKAFVGQAHLWGARGENNAQTYQHGNHNTAGTFQVIANPFYRREEDGKKGDKNFKQGKNNSLIVQPADYDHAFVFQGSSGGGENNQMTLQKGAHNWAFTAQISSSNVSNSSFTGQFGNHNIAGTFQH